MVAVLKACERFPREVGAVIKFLMGWQAQQHDTFQLDEASLF